ncbi:MAG: hypothetical protein ACREX4_08735 [Gammaproteobacteria bacterium]
MIVADTGALVALIDADDQHHEFVRNFFERDPDAWLVPWAVLPEVDYLVSAHVGEKAGYALMTDLCEGIYLIDWESRQTWSERAILITGIGYFA